MANKNIDAKICPTFTESSERTNITSGENIKTSFGKIKKYFSDLKTVAFTGSYNDLTDKPTIPSSAVTGVKGDTETNYRTGDVNITAANIGAVRYDTSSQDLTNTQKSNARTNIGLGNVENKSSATIRSEITSSNVTNALGYTPVNKAGDSISGTFNFDANTVFNYTNGTSTEATIELDSDNCLYIDSSNPLYISGGPVIVPTYFNIEIISSLNDDESAYVLGSVWLTDDDYRQGRVVRITNESLFSRVFSPSAANPQSHASIFRGKYLGSSFTSAQKAAIADGSFDDLYVGDYWTIGGVNWRIADINYFKCSTNTVNHLVIMPDSGLYIARMNSTNTTSGGYYGSEMRSSNLSSALTTIRNAFGSSYIYTHSESVSNAVDSNGLVSGGVNADIDVILPTACMMYGSPPKVNYSGATDWNSGNARAQLALCRICKEFIEKAGNMWLRDVASTVQFHFVNGGTGVCNSMASSHNSAIKVRPYFCLKGV